MSQRIEPQAVPETGVREIGEALVVGLAGMVPVVGPLTGALTAQMFGQQAEARRQQWLTELAVVMNATIDRVDELEARDLITDPVFYDAVVQASYVATGTASQDKRAALQNGLLNIGTAKDADIDADLYSVFLRYVQELTPTHLRILGFFRDPKSAFTVEHVNQISQHPFGSMLSTLEQALPELLGQQQITRLATRDLSTRLLLGEIPLDTNMTGSGTLSPRTTLLGTQFIEFISGPFNAASGSPAEETA